jgi:hypothetical protein
VLLRFLVSYIARFSVFHQIRPGWHPQPLHPGVRQKCSSHHTGLHGRSPGQPDRRAWTWPWRWYQVKAHIRGWWPWQTSVWQTMEGSSARSNVKLMRWPLSTLVWVISCCTAILVCLGQSTSVAVTLWDGLAMSHDIGCLSVSVAAGSGEGAVIFFWTRIWTGVENFCCGRSRISISFYGSTRMGDLLGRPRVLFLFKAYPNFACDKWLRCCLLLRIRNKQQLSLLSQASWGRLEMKPTRNKGRRSTRTQKHKRKRKDHVSGTFIASLQALLSITNSLGMSTP